MVAMPDDLIPSTFSDDEPEWFDELEQAVDAGDAGLVDEIAQRPIVRGWEITSVAQAEVVMRRLRAATARRAAVQVQARAWLEPIEEWELDQLRRVQPSIEFWTEQLRRFGIAHRREFPKEATIRLPSGEIPTQQGKQPTVSVVDEAAVVAWCEAIGFIDAVKVDKSVRLKELRLAVKSVEEDSGFCDQCGETIEFYVDTGWVHPGELVEYDHAARPAKELVAVLVDGPDTTPVPGVKVEPPKITATPKPRW